MKNSKERQEQIRRKFERLGKSKEEIARIDEERITKEFSKLLAEEISKEIDRDIIKNLVETKGEDEQ